MLGAVVAFSLTAIAGREAAADVTVSQLVFFRNIIGLVLISGLLALFSPDAFRTRSLRIHTGRNISHFAGQWCWFFGIMSLPLAEVFAIEFTVPLWTAGFAMLILGEKLTPRRMQATVLGFIGVLIILRPGFNEIEFASWVVLAGAMAYAFSHTLTKKLASGDSVATILFYMHLIQLPLAALLVSFDFEWPASAETWGYIAATSVAALIAHWCMAKALASGDATLVMPVDFLRLPFAALLGYLLYGEGVDLWLVAGAGIMLFGNFRALREKQR